MKKEKLNILFINRWVGYNHGGNETHIKELISWFSNLGHNVTVITTEGHELDDLSKKANLIFVRSYKGYFSFSKVGLLYALSFNFKVFVVIAKLLLIQKQRFDLLSVHFSLEAYLARFIKLIFGIPYVMVVAGNQYLELMEARRADGCIQICEYMQEQAEKFGFSGEVIPKGFDLSKFRPNVATESLKSDLNVEGKKVILSVCRLDPRKNLVTLIEAANIIVNYKNTKSIKFIIVGSGVEYELLKELITKYDLSSYVHLVGSVPDTKDALASYYCLANLFVLPTLHETFGWVYIEAMACGLPILTTNVGSVPEVVGGIGELIEPRKPELLAEHIINLLSNDQKLLIMREKGLEKARTLDWNCLIGKYNDYYLRIADKHPVSIKSRLDVVKYILVDTPKMPFHL